MATMASPADPLAETRLRVSAVLSWPRYRPSAAEVADSVWENSDPYDGLASGSIYFLTRDPLVTLTRSPYGYVHDNPLNRIDPSGLVVTSDSGGGGTCSGYSAAYDYCEVTLQLCTSHWTADLCHDLGQAVVDQYNTQLELLIKEDADPCNLQSGAVGATEEYLTELRAIFHTIRDIAIPELNHEASCDASRDLGLFVLIVGGGTGIGEGVVPLRAGELLKALVVSQHVVGYDLAGGALMGAFGGGCSP